MGFIADNKGLTHMKDKILVVGGYGQVGQYATLKLASMFPGKVIVAGRSLAKANDFAEKHNGLFDVLQLDIYDSDNIPAVMSTVCVVVMCLMPKNNGFAKFCIRADIHYVDISPSYDVIKKFEKLREDAVINNSTCVLGVGLAPGLSNLLVKKAKQQFDVLQKAKIYLMLGLGEAHGNDGVKWFLDNVHSDFVKHESGTNKKIKPFVRKSKTTFAEPLGVRSAYSFNIADQFIIPKTLHIENVESYFCYDSRAITFLVSMLKRLGVFRLLKWKTSYNLISRLFNVALRLFHKWNIGTDVYSVQVDAFGTINGKKHSYHIGAIGHNNSSLTGEVAAIVASQLYEGNCPNEIFYFEDLFSLEDLEKFGIRPKIEVKP